MANLNKVFLIGNLTRDPELRYTPQGTPVARLGLAVNRQWTGQDKQKHEETCFVDVDAWGRSAEICNEYLKKGRPILVEGRLTFHQWEGQDGKKQSRLRVTMENFQFLGGPRSAEEPRSGTREPADAPAGEPGNEGLSADPSVPF